MHKYLAVTILLFAPSLLHADIIAISQPIFTGHQDAADFGQSFTATFAAVLTRIRLHVSTSLGGSDFTLRLYNFNRSTLTLGSTVLGADTVFESELSPTAAWVDAIISPGVSLAAGQSYAFTIDQKDSGLAGWNNYGMTFTDVYSGGEHFSGLTGTVSTASNAEEVAFELYVVPEASGFGLLALGMMCVAATFLRTAGPVILPLRSIR